MLSTYLRKMRLSSLPESRIPLNDIFRSMKPCTWRALLYFFMSASPMMRKDGRLFQHVFMAHEPLTPWHLHSVRNRLFTICPDKRFVRCCCCWWCSCRWSGHSRNQKMKRTEIEFLLLFYQEYPEYIFIKWLKMGINQNCDVYEKKPIHINKSILFIYFSRLRKK